MSVERLTIVCLAIVFISAACDVRAEQAYLKKTITLADISDKPAKKIRRFQPLADYLAAHLGNFGISAGKVKIARDPETLARWMAGGVVDLYFDSPYPAMMVCGKSGAHPVLRRWKDGVAEYSSVIFARKDGPASAEQLKGKIIGFEKPVSTSGYMLPIAHLVKEGFNPVGKDNENSETAESEIGYIFSGDQQNTIRWVLNGKIAAGAIGRNKILELPEKTRSSLKVLAETEKTARQLVVAGPGLDKSLLEAVRVTLVKMNETKDGRIVLKHFANTAKFDEFPGAEAELARMRMLYDIVKNR